MYNAPQAHILSVTQFANRHSLQNLFDRTAELKSLQRWQYPKPLRGKVVATLFYEPSTRTRLSFETAVQLLGGQVITTESASQFSSAAKGETLEDTVRVISGYADIIVLRHPDHGAAKRAASVATVPIINAGDGVGEHPTQALLDLFTIYEAKGKIDGLNVGLVGDLKYGRTVHSLAHLLELYDTVMTGIAPVALAMPKSADWTVRNVHSWDNVIEDLDVIYMTRIQKERFASGEEYEANNQNIVLNSKILKRVKRDAIIMHPLPRLTEIATEVDTDPRAIYFAQAHNGLFLRMALLDNIITGGQQ